MVSGRLQYALEPYNVPTIRQFRGVPIIEKGSKRKIVSSFSLDSRFSKRKVLHVLKISSASLRLKLDLQLRTGPPLRDTFSA